MKFGLAKKMAAIAGLALVLMLVLLMIEGMVYERSSYRAQARSDIARSWTGEQTLIGPILVQPWRERVPLAQDASPESRRSASRLRHHLVLPNHLEVTAELATELRYRGIYEVPVYTAKMQLSGVFSESSLPRPEAVDGEVDEWMQPYLAVMVSDPRGLSNNPELVWGGESVSFQPGSRLVGLAEGIHAPLPERPSVSGDLAYSLDITLRGMHALDIAPVGEVTQTQIRSGWQHPSFSGRYLPTAREIGDEGFSAEWETSRFASNIDHQVRACGEGNCSSLRQNHFGVRLVEPVDVYLQTERSVKYGMLFIVLTFVAFFLFEVLKRSRIHPMQYALVGVALALFYLLLLALSEHMLFGLAYLLASLMCVGLLGFYMSHLIGWRYAGLFVAALAIVYLALYVIIRSEAHALVMGSGLLFIALALAMFATRKVDWYALSEGRAAHTSRLD